MTKKELITRLLDIEWEDFEVKEARSEVPKNAWQTVSAFSNTAGGWIVFGVKHAGKSFIITGVANPENAEPRYTFRLTEQENIWEYYFAIFQRLRKYVDVPFQMATDGFAIEKSPALDAIREALVNLLMHTDYFSPAKPRIRVFSNRIEFYNPGPLPKPLEIILTEDVSIPRNPILARLFRMVRLAENAGFGFDKMRLGWKETGTEPQIETGLDSFKITFTLPEKIVKKSGEKLEKTRKKFGEEFGEKFGEKFGKKFGKNLTAIIYYMQKDRFITIPRLAEKIGLSTRAVEKNIKQLTELGIIRRVGPAKGGYWEVMIN